VRTAICALWMLLSAVAWATSPGDLRARLQTVQDDLRMIESAQMMYGGPFPPQLITDISRHVALPAQLEEWRGAAKLAATRLDAGQLRETAAVLDPLAATTGAARARAEDIVHYWVLRVVYDRRIAQWDRFIATNRVEPPQTAQITAARQRLDAAIATHDFRVAGRTLLPELDSLLTAGFNAGSNLALRVERDDRLAEQRAAPCPPPPAGIEPSPTANPKLDLARSQPNDSYFPQRARREERNGRVGVETEVDASGCATRAIVLVSSGEPDIDRAALDWALRGGVFRPARGADGPVAGRVRFWVKFELLNR
jgi:TonB family protein